MLVGCRVEDDLWSAAAEDLCDTTRDRRVADQWEGLHPREHLAQLEVERVQAILMSLEEDQQRRLISRDLPAELRPDGPAGAGDQHTLAFEQWVQLLKVRPDRLALQEVLEAHGPDVPYR